MTIILSLISLFLMMLKISMISLVCDIFKYKCLATIIMIEKHQILLILECNLLMNSHEYIHHGDILYIFWLDNDNIMWRVQKSDVMI